MHSPPEGSMMYACLTILALLPAADLAPAADTWPAFRGGGASDHVYFFGKDGTATVLKAGPTFEKIASNRLWGPDKLPARPAEKPKEGEAKGPPGAAGFEYLDPIVCGVAAVDGAFFVRTGTALYRVGKP